SSAGGRAAPSPAPATGAEARPAAEAAESAAEEAGSGPPIDATAAFARASEAISRAGRSTLAAADAATGPAVGTPVVPPPATATAATPATAVTPAAAAPAAPATLPAVAGLGRESTLDDAAAALAGDLRAVPGIERFGRMRLADLDRTGPRPLRTMWRIARDRLDERYGELTIGEIIDRYRGTGGTSASA
ncbi:MAG TPA: hypothetical protein VFV53_03215, partial [Candidatus Limnocylindrales bacterium]|nr:hypothetical protein [Candidatus Limnocylindrales bacterium]